MSDHSVGQEIRTAADPGSRHSTSRAAIETMIDQLVDLLDFVDGDADAEEDDPDDEDADEDDDRSDIEPSLGAPDGDGDRNQVFWAEGDAADGELDEVDDEPGGDDEPWLAAPETDGDQTAWNRGAASDCEETRTIEDAPLLGRFYRLRSETELLRQIEAEALVLAGRLRRKYQPVKPKRRADPAWIAALRPCQ